MKTYTTIIKTILPLFVVIGMAGAVQAQVSATAQASANITTALALTKDADINFGTVAATTTSPVYLNPTDVSQSTNVGNSRTLGEFTVGAAPADEIKITFDQKVTLTSGSDNLYLLAQVAGSESGTSMLDLGATGTALFTTSSGRVFKLAVGGYLVEDETDTFASPGNLSGVPTGNYTGTFNAEIIYN